MLRKIKLYGPLAKFVGRDVLEADVASPAEAVRMLLANFSGLEAHIRKHSYRIFCGDVGLQAAEEVLFPTSAPEIKIVPVVLGSGGGDSGGIFTIIAGVALIGLSAVSFGAGGLFAGAFGVTGIGATAAGAAAAGGYALGSIALFSIGAGLVLLGTAQLLTPTPEMPKPGDSRDSKDPRNGFSFSGLQNVSRPGVPVPMVYGKTLVGSVVISAGVDVFHSKVAPAAPSSSAAGTVFVFDANGNEL